MPMENKPTSAGETVRGSSPQQQGGMSPDDRKEQRRQQQAEHGGTGGQDMTGQRGDKKMRDRQQRGGQADNTRQ